MKKLIDVVRDSRSFLNRYMDAAFVLIIVTSFLFISGRAYKAETFRLQTMKQRIMLQAYENDLEIISPAAPVVMPEKINKRLVLRDCN